MVMLSLVAAACASNPSSAPVSIEYRNMKPGAEPGGQPVPAVRPYVAAPTGSLLSAVEEAKALTPEATSRPGGPLTAPPDDPAARRIVVQRGDSLYDLSLRYMVNTRALIETNHLEPPYALDVGQTLVLPPPNVHVVQRGETLYSISRRYNVDTRSLAVMNRMQRPWVIHPGDELLLPPLARDQERIQEARTAPLSAPSSQPARSTPPRQAPADTGSSAPISLTPVAPSPPAYVSNPPGSHEFIWPVAGRVLRGFGESGSGEKNDGVNIAADRGQSIMASADGEVAYAGSDLEAFGNLILVRHANGWITAYAHADKLLVKQGDKVLQGQTIANVGATGIAERPQLHFELRKGKQPVDPAGRLPIG
ncbi:MAG: LysM peptidoglycan-binding domain-containing M23 family metallopeptidase [Hyphomonadaceae bacterium]